MNDQTAVESHKKIELDIAQATPFGAVGYVLWLPLPEADGDSADDPQHSLHVLLEDGIELLPRHALHDEIAGIGGGAYSHWHNVLYFSASDNSDPRKNGRLYMLERRHLSRRKEQVSLETSVTRARQMFENKVERLTTPCGELRSGCCRLLPYPYQNAISIASDTDLMTPSMAEAIHQMLENEFGLNLADSFWPSGNLACQPKDVCVFFEGASSKPRPKVSSKLLTMRHRGWFDCIHSWDDDFVEALRIVSDFRKEIRGEAKGKIPLQIPSSQAPHAGQYGLILEHEIGESIQEAELHFVDSKNITHVLVLRGNLGQRPGWTTADLDANGRLYYYKERNVSTSECLGTRGHCLHDIIFVAKGEGAFAIETLSALPFHREIVKNQLPVLRRYQFLPRLFVSHGGKEWLSSITRADNSGPAVGGQEPMVGAGDLPNSPAYYYDILAAEGVRYIWPARPAFHKNDYRAPLTSRMAPVADYLQLMTMRDGQYSYCGPRFMLEADEANPLFCRDSTHHHNENVGFQLAGLILRCCKETGQCAVLYTHWGATDTMDQPELHVFNQMTRDVLSLLSDLQSRVSGQPGPRIWVTPSSVLLRYAAMIRQLPRRSSVDGNVVQIHRWRDPVLGEIAHFKTFLHGATFYVEDPYAARVLVDGELFGTFKRNPPDASGQPSVTLIDSSVATVIHGSVSFREQMGLLEPVNGCYSFEEDSAAGKFSSTSRLPAHLTFYPDDVCLGDGRFFSFDYRKSYGEIRFGVLLRFASGDNVFWTEGNVGNRGSKFAGDVFPPAAAGEWRRCVFDLRDLRPDADGKSCLPRGRLELLKVFLRGEAKDGSFVEFKELRFLSERDTLGPANEVVLGGWVEPSVRDLTVVLCRDNETLTTRTNEVGFFCFDSVRKGATVELWAELAGVRVYPQGLRRFEASRCNCDITIQLPAFLEEAFPNTQTD